MHNAGKVFISRVLKSVGEMSGNFAALENDTQVNSAWPSFHG